MASGASTIVEPEMAPVGVPIERLFDRGGRADERELDIEVAGGGDGAVHDRRRRMVAAHRVNGDVGSDCDAICD